MKMNFDKVKSFFKVNKAAKIIGILVGVLLLLNIVQLIKPKKVLNMNGAKVGFINMVQIQMEAKVMKDLNRQNQEFVKKLEKDVERKRKEFSQTESRLQKQQGSLSAEAFARKVNEFRNDVMMYDKQTSDKLQSAKMVYNEALQEIQKDYLNDIINDVSGEYGYDIIVDANNAKVLNSDFDITDKVIDKLDSKINSKKISNKFKK